MISLFGPRNSLFKEKKLLGSKKKIVSFNFVRLKNNGVLKVLKIWLTSNNIFFIKQHGLI